jgi:hypothetical protein
MPQFHPYRLGCVIRPVRLAPKTAATTTAVTAATDPSKVTHAGTARCRDSVSSALRLPTTAQGGRPADAMSCAIADGRFSAGLAAERIAPPGQQGKQPEQHRCQRGRSEAENETIRLYPARGVEPAKLARHSRVSSCCSAVMPEVPPCSRTPIQAYP